MTTAQLITELEKPRKNYPLGVLTWEEGDEAVHKKYGYKFIVIDVEIGSENSPGDELSGRSRRGIKASNCTHSADDARLLGRVLRELGDDFIELTHASIKWRLALKSNRRIYTADTLLEAALRALLEKTEGEKS